MLENCRLTAGQFINNRVVPDQKNCIEAPADNSHLAIEIKVIHQEIAVAVTLYNPVIDLIPLAVCLSHDAFQNTGIRVRIGWCAATYKYMLARQRLSDISPFFAGLAPASFSVNHCGGRMVQIIRSGIAISGQREFPDFVYPAFILRNAK